jgi:hypothetical protein
MQDDRKMKKDNGDDRKKTLTMLTKHRERLRMYQIGLWGNDRAGGCTAGRADDATLDGRADRCVGCYVIRQHLVHDVLRGATGVDIRIPVATRRHEIVLGDGVGGSGSQVNWSTGTGPIRSLADNACHTASCRSCDLICEAQSGDLREASLGRWHQ